MRMIIACLALILSTPLAADIGDFAFATGNWKLEREGSAPITYSWQAPVGEVMVGTFVVPGNDGEFRFAELILVEETPTGLTLRLKHHRRDYTTWEDGGPLTLTLAEARANYAHFEDADAAEGGLKSLTYELKDGHLMVGVQFVGREPAVRRYDRVQ